MEAAAASSSSSSSVSSLLGHRLRATARRCFGNGGERMRLRWRRRAGAGEFRYDPLSYALNFDDGDLLGVDDEDHRPGDRFPCRSFSSQLTRTAAA